MRATPKRGVTGFALNAASDKLEIPLGVRDNRSAKNLLLVQLQFFGGFVVNLTDDGAGEVTVEFGV
jgi:hypothetical protein